MFDISRAILRMCAQPHEKSDAKRELLLSSSSSWDTPVFRPEIGF